MNIDKKLTSREIEELKTFLLSEKTPVNCMSFEELDGFLTCIVLAPELLMPGEWLSAVWGAGKDDEVIWDSEADMRRIFDFIFRLYQSIAESLEEKNKHFSPTLPSSSDGLIALENWCRGFYQGIELDPQSWESLLTTRQGYKLLLPIF